MGLLEAGGDVEVLEVRQLLGEAEDVGGDPLGLVVVLLPVGISPRCNTSSLPL